MNSFKNHLSLTPSHERDLSLFYSDPSPSTQASGPEATQVYGKVVRLNGHELALFCYKDKFYAVNEKCPHMGTSTTYMCTKLFLHSTNWFKCIYLPVVSYPGSLIFSKYGLKMRLYFP